MANVQIFGVKSPVCASVYNHLIKSADVEADSKNNKTSDQLALDRIVVWQTL